jgi:hypothetical protein
MVTIISTLTTEICGLFTIEGSLKMNSALEYSTRVVQGGGRRCKKSTLNDLVQLTPLRIPLMNPPHGFRIYIKNRPIIEKHLQRQRFFLSLGFFTCIYVA